MRDPGIEPVRREAPDGSRTRCGVAGRDPLTSGQQYDLVQLIRDGDREALDRLIDINRPFVVKFAGRYRGRGLSDLDLVAEGTIGLIGAARRGDVDPDLQFMSVAVWWIHRAIRAAIAEQLRFGSA